ncbi:ZnMc domain-containing protein [Trichostrongylus colubriformis]|uniref:ZnMc domain-containing protein n=1 Tax=Trichostrongylus colubriformis TaxID=6319 RepID=A0AAN8ICM6_TRICO
MFSAKRPYDPDFALGDDDVRAIRVLFPLDGKLEDDHAFDSPPSKSGSGNREMTISQVVENLLGGPPPVATEPMFANADELTFPFPLPQTRIRRKSALVL